MTLGKKIYELRKKHELTQEQFAVRFHVTRQTVSNWENDKNYPDMSILKAISDEYNISFDELLKEDELYIKSVDTAKKQISGLKKICIALVVIFVSLIALIVGVFFLIHFAYQPTDDGDRINSDTNYRMLVNIDGQSPSRAITYTIEKTKDDEEYKKRLENLKEQALGRIEGDMPCVYLKYEPVITLHFQDLAYYDIKPSNIKSVTCDLYDKYSGKPRKKYVKKDIPLEYTYADGNVSIKTDTKLFAKNMESMESEYELWYEMNICIIYEYGGKEYASVTAMSVCEKEHEWLDMN